MISLFHSFFKIKINTIARVDIILTTFISFHLEIVFFLLRCQKKIRMFCQKNIGNITLSAHGVTSIHF